MLKKSFFAVAAVLIVTSCGHNHVDHDHDHEAEHSHIEQESHDEHGDKHDGIVVLSSEMAKRFGVEVDSVVAAPMTESLKCSALIERAAGSEGVVVAPVAGIARYSVPLGAKVGQHGTVARISTGAVSGGDANRAAKAAYEAALAEVERLKPLYEEKLVTAADYRAAVAALEQARAAYSPTALTGVASSPIGGTVTGLLVPDGSFVEAGSPVATVAADSRLSLSAQVSAEHYADLKNIRDIRIKTHDGRSVLLSELQGRSGGVSSANGYATIVFNFSNDGTLAPGSTVEAWLLGEATSPVISVPVAAVTEQQGEHYVYKEMFPEHYQKIPVTLGGSDGSNIRLVSGVSEGDRIVTRGAMTVRLAESSGAVPEGHTHNH